MPRVIVSLTSYPKRIKTCVKTIMSLMTQTVMPDKIILWLAYEEFPDREKALPEELRKLKDFGLEIMWCKNLKSHKKYFFAMQRFPKDIIITADDDIVYNPRVVETLYLSYLKNPACISCLMAHEIMLSERNVCNYEYWGRNSHYFESPVDRLLACGCAGVLYPPGIMPMETFCEKEMMKIALHEDDLWLKGMELLAGRKVVLTGRGMPAVEVDKSVQKDGLYNTINKEGGNDEALLKLQKHLDIISGIENFMFKRIYEDKQLFDNTRKHFEDCIQNGIVIYGAGEGADLVYHYLIMKSEGAIKPKCFVVTETGNEVEKYGIPIVSISEYAAKSRGREVIIVAVAAEKQSDIKNTLRNYGFNKAFYIDNEVFYEMRVIISYMSELTRYMRYE